MNRKLVLAAALALVSVSSSLAYAEALVVVGEGPERHCFQAAKTGLDLIAGVGHCNIALNNPLIIEDRVATFVNRGVILHKLNRIDSAMADFNAALRINPEQADAWLNRGVAKLSLKDYADALVDIQKGIELGPSEPAVAYFNRAIAYERLNRIADAYYDYQRALKAAPNWPAAASALARFKVTPRT
jgi:tetratricopeptide (TPR) repeat protein